MRINLWLSVFVLFFFGLSLGCNKQDGSGEERLPESAIQAGKYVILDTRTDQGDPVQAKKKCREYLKEISGYINIS